MNDRYVSMYVGGMNMYYNINQKRYNINIPTKDIVSIGIINNYDSMTFPIIRIRIYTDLEIIQKILDNADILYVSINFNSSIYMYNDNDDSKSQYTIIGSGNSLSYIQKVYIESKNAPTSKFDQFENGLPRTTDLNDNNKVPFEFYCYEENIIHKMQKRTKSIYKDISLQSVLNDILITNDIPSRIDPLDNQNRYKQILLPNLNVMESLIYLDRMYGLYEKGSQVFYDENKLLISNTDTQKSLYGNSIPIYVKSYKSNSDMVGLIKLPDGNMGISVNSTNVSVLTESNIEKTLNGNNINSINVNTFDTTSVELNKLYDKFSNENNLEKISTPDIIHKTSSKYISSMLTARVNERITRIDLSYSGVDIYPCCYKRFNLIFETPIRGLNMNELYRPVTICHLLTNIDGTHFTPQTTMTLCSN